MPPFKIAYLLAPDDFGGAERVSLNFLRSVDRNTFDIYLFLLVSPWEKDSLFIKKIEKEKYPVYKIPVASRPKNEGRDYLRILKCFRRIRSYLKRGAFNLLHTHGYFADIVGIPAAKSLKIPCVSTCHGFISNDIKLKLYNRLDSFVLRLSDRVIAVSDGIKNDLVKSGIKELHVNVIFNAVHTNLDDMTFIRNRQIKRQQSGINEKEFVIGYIGRLSEEKGLEYLIKAVSMLNRSEISPKVLMIGEGAQIDELKGLVQDLNLENSVSFVGFQSDTESWMPALDVFVLPSMMEGTPMSMLEAMSCRVPVIASAVGGVPAVIRSGKNGILVSPGKPAEIRDAICNIYENEDLRKSISTAALETISSKYNIKDWVGKIEAEYSDLINNKNLPMYTFKG